MGKKKSKELTDLAITKKYKPMDEEYWVRDGDGLALRIYPTGGKVWHYIYTNSDGKKRILRMGEYPDLSLSKARDKRDDLRKLVSNGVDPLIEQKQEHHKRKTAKTVSDLVKDYIEKHAKVKKPKSWQEDERILNKDIVPRWGGIKAIDVKQEDVIDLIADLQPRGNAITLNTFKIVRKMFNYARKNKIITVSPCEDLTQTDDDIPTVPSRERTLHELEVKTVWEGLDKASMCNSTKRALKLILVTCQRPGEVVAMHRSEIKGDWWEFTPKVTKITKETPREQRIYLTATAKALIGDENGYIFPSHVTEDKIVRGKKVVSPKHILEKSVAYAIRKNLKGYTRQRPAKEPDAGDIPKMVKVKESRKLDVSHFRPHDLRRTGATFLSKLGFSDEVVDVVLAHLKKGTIKAYNRYKYDNPKREAMLALEQKLKDILAGKDTGDEETQNNEASGAQPVAAAEAVDAATPQSAKHRPRYRRAPDGSRLRIFYDESGVETGTEPVFLKPANDKETA
jgi:integrase